jgi:putative transposase
MVAGQGKPVAEAIRSRGDGSYILDLSLADGVRRAEGKELEAENTRLRRAVSDLTVEKLILKEAASGNF